MYRYNWFLLPNSYNMICVELPAGGFWSSDCKKYMVCDSELSKCAQYLDALLLVLIVREIWPNGNAEPLYIVSFFDKYFTMWFIYCAQISRIIVFMSIMTLSLNFEKGLLKDRTKVHQCWKSHSYRQDINFVQMLDVICRSYPILCITQ